MEGSPRSQGILMQTEEEEESLQCFLYCSANKLGTRPFDSRSLKNDKKYWGNYNNYNNYCYKGVPIIAFQSRIGICIWPAYRKSAAFNWNCI